MVVEKEIREDTQLLSSHMNNQDNNPWFVQINF